MHPESISRLFRMSRYEVTQAQLAARLGVNPAFFQGTRFPNAAQQPVEQAAGRVPAGYVYRLPTEAEREHCCRSGTSTPDMTDGFRVVLAPALP